MFWVLSKVHIYYINASQLFIQSISSEILLEVNICCASKLMLNFQVNTNEIFIDIQAVILTVVVSYIIAIKTNTLVHGSYHNVYLY